MEKSDKKAQNRSRIVRWVVLLVVLVLITTMTILHQVAATKPAGVDALCPFGGLESLATVVSSGVIMQRIALSSFVLLLATVVIAIIFRRSFCGNICPLGTLQELFGNLGRVVLKRRGPRPEVPAALDKVARYLKYLVLIVFLALTWTLGSLVIRPYDPWVAYAHITSDELFAEFGIGAAILLLSLVGSFFYDRFFCKYLCPMGAFLAPLSKLGLFKVARKADACINCGICDKACPMNIKVSKLEQVKSAECISCNACVNSCPAKNALVVEGPKSKRISPLTVTLGTAAIFAAVVGVASATGNFKWTIPPLSHSVEVNAEGVSTLNIEDIKGSNTFADISRVSGIPKEEFKHRFGLSDAEFEGPVKDKAHAPGATFATDDVRVFVAEKLGIPYEGEEE